MQLTFLAGDVFGGQMPSRGDTRWVERPLLVKRLDAAASAGRLIVFDARPGFGSRTAVRMWLAHHPDWQVAWDDTRLPPDGPVEVLRRGLRILEHLPDSAPAGGRTVLVVEYSPRLADQVQLLDVASLSSSRRDVTVVVCTGGRLGDRAPERGDIEVVTDADLSWDLALATEGLERRGLQLSDEHRSRLVALCEGSPGRIIACAQLRTEYAGASAERMYGRWLHDRLSRHGADRLLLLLDVLGDVPLELAPTLVDTARVGEDALDLLLADQLVAQQPAVSHDGRVLRVTAPEQGVAVLRSLVPARGANVPVADVARALAARVAPGTLQALYWAAIGGDADAARHVVRSVLAHPDPHVIERVADTRWLLVGRPEVDPAFVAACVLIECGRGGDPRDVPDAENLLRLTETELAERSAEEQATIRAARVVMLSAAGRPLDVLVEADAALARLEYAPWEHRSSWARIRNVVHVALLVAHTELLDLKAAARHARTVIEAPVGERWLASIEAAAGIALFIATLQGDLATVEEVEPLTRMREAEGAPPASTVLLARYVDAMNARDLGRMAELANALRVEQRASQGWDMLRSFAIKDMAFRGRTPDSLAESARDRDDLVPLLRAVALDLRARQLIEMGRPGLALRLLEGLDSDPRHVFCFAALRARALIAMGFPQAALRELEACESVQGHSRRTSWRVRIARVVALSRSGMPSVATAAFEALAADVPARWWGGVINWARFPELTKLCVRVGAPGPHDGESDDVLREPLTPREVELLGLLRGEASIQQLAAQQFVSLNTMKTHVRNMYRKLGAASRSEAVDRAMRAGLFDAFRFLGE